MYVKTEGLYIVCIEMKQIYTRMEWHHLHNKHDKPEYR